MGEAVIFPRMGTIKEAADASGLADFKRRGKSAGTGL